MKPRPAGHRRRGAVLVYFAMLMFGILAMAALVIDVGFAIVTRRQMQTAVDGAAIEGLRFRDDPDGRERAKKLVRAVFDDDLDPANGDPHHYGAGPVLNFTGGIVQDGSSFRPSETFALDDSPVYKPSDFQTNTADNPAGDMVGGIYHDDRPPGEDSDYSREDFTPGGAPMGPHDALAFLVRMRRSNEEADPDQGISTGPPLPDLFGRGSLLNPEVKARGITVRATAIAAARPAMSVGRPQPNSDPTLDLQGVTPFGLDQVALWDHLDVGSAGAVSARLAGDGTFVVVDPQTGQDQLVGRFLGPNPPQSIGLPTDTLPSVGTSRPIRGYVPILRIIAQDDQGSQPQERVIGFGHALLEDDTPDPQGRPRLKITKFASSLAPGNISAVPTTSLPSLNAFEITRLFEAQKQLIDPLLAPTLVR